MQYQPAVPADRRPETGLIDPRLQAVLPFATIMAGGLKRLKEANCLAAGPCQPVPGLSSTATSMAITSLTFHRNNLLYLGFQAACDACSLGILYFLFKPVLLNPQKFTLRCTFFSNEV